MTTAPQVDVVVQVLGEDVLAGQLWTHRRRGESATFVYDPAYLSRTDTYALDPIGLPKSAGQHQTAAGRKLFAAFTDCAPDHWGRLLVDRATSAGEPGARSRTEADHLLAVRDDMRQGALRFRRPGERAYLADEHAPIPLVVDLPRLLNAADRLADEEATQQELQSLLHGGSSLGGARPKAHVIAPNGRVAIAKFPSPTTDAWDVIRWEAVALTLARDAGVVVPDFSLEVVEDRPVVIVDRFDRHGDERLGYVSAMTMLQATDGDAGSYEEIAEAIEEHALAVEADLRQLWRRILFSALIRNTDDHLRNHGFLRAPGGGWTLSPAFDLNPNPAPGAVQHTPFTAAGAPVTVPGLVEHADLYRLSRREAMVVLNDVTEAVGSWERVAGQLRIPAAQVRAMRPAFVHQHESAARRLLS